MISTPPHTSTNANKVPMLVRSVTSVRFMNNDGIATTRPVTMVENHGVLNRGWMEEKMDGSRPSRLIDIQMRGCPSWNTSKTVAMAITALIAIIPETHGMLTPSGPNTYARGSPTARLL